MLPEWLSREVLGVIVIAFAVVIILVARAIVKAPYLEEVSRPDWGEW